MMRRFSWLLVIVGLAVLGGCPDDPYKAETWTKKLGDQRESEHAVTELEHLGNPTAIEAIGKTWIDQGKPPRLLQVIISLARPLTPEQANKENYTDYATSGRPASWEKALPYLKQALSEVDEANRSSVESAEKSAEALGESKLPEGLDALIEIATKPVTKKLITAQIAAIRAIGKYTSDTGHAAGALIKVIDKDPPPSPRTAKEKDAARALAETYNRFLAVSRAAIDALGDLHAGAAAKPLVLAMFRTPDLLPNLRSALIASGPSAFEELRRALAGTHPEVNQLLKDKRLDKYCGDRNDAPPDQCQPVSVMYAVPASVIGDFFDARAVPDLLAAIKGPPVPVAYADDQPSPATQYNTVLDALSKIGSADAAPTVRALWLTQAAPAGKPARGKRGAEAAKGSGEIDPATRILAINAYPFVAHDDAGVEELGKIASDNGAEAQLRQAAATAFALLAHDTKDITVLQGLAQKYFEGSATERAKADGKPKAAADAADKEFAKAKKLLDDAKAAVLKATHDTSKSAADIRAATDEAKKAEDAFKAAKKTHADAVAPYKAADGNAKRFKNYARMFQTHIARVEVAMRCKQDITCYGNTLKLKPADAAKNVAPYVKDLKDWTSEDQVGLVEASIERAMLELGTRGKQASGLTDVLLDSAKTDDRVVLQSVLFALPKIAAVPCGNCEAKLQDAIHASEGKTTLAELNLGTKMLKNYFGWAGGKTPSSAPAEKKGDAQAPAAPAAPA
ncbi:MAG TPA: hypothetical protein VF469_18205, partial [Kofleriaceae bacterium]